MTIDREIDYEGLAQSALRGVVRSVLSRVAKSGLPGEHHFYIAFRTDAPGVLLSKRLKQKYPEEMTVVLQHRFWDLVVRDERFEVKLTFDGLEELLSIPFAAIKVFFDPSVPYGLQFEDAAGTSTQDKGVPKLGAGQARDLARNGEGGLARARVEKKPRQQRRPASEKMAERTSGSDRLPAQLPAAATHGEPTPAANDAKVVKLDTFRKK